MICEFDHPLEPIMGTRFGEILTKEHTKAGVKIHAKAKVTELRTNEAGNVTQVVLSNGTVVDTDLVILGTGVRPNTQFLKGVVEMNPDGGLVCDPFLETSAKGVFAAGDIASYPYWPSGSRIRTEHWNTALDQGTHAAFNMLNKYVPYGSIPFFWTRHYNKTCHYVGNGAGSKEVHFVGTDDSFLAYYISENDKVLAVAGMGQPKATLTFLEAMQ
jgi:NADPH-dependent 2,4-dienoyl-CoA reductase/sulfur reductase-like enzyme